ncbi:E3 ubiquitin-protein ligase TRIM45-like [Glandiceps talaboti]
MAVTGDINEFLHKIDDNFVSCPICRKQYKEPKILPCLHTFCQQCLIHYVKKHGDLKCSTCQRTCQLPDGGVKVLTTNLFMKSLVDLIVERRRLELNMKELICDVCKTYIKEKQTLSSKVCIDCSHHFCDTCIDTEHKRTNTMCSHRMVTIDEYQKTNIPAKFQNPGHCTRHRKHEMEFFCDTCQVPVCTECMISEHKVPKHAYRDLKDAAGEYRGQLEQTVHTLKEKEQNVLAFKHDIKEKPETIRTKTLNSCNTEQQKVEERAEEIIRKVRQEEKRLKDELQHKCDLRLKDLDKEIDEPDLELTPKHENISSTCNYVETLMHHGNDVHLLSTKQLTTSRVDELVAMEIISDVEFFSCDKMDNSDRVGEIRYNVDVSQCIIKNIPSHILKGDSVDIVMTTKDNLGKPVLPRQPITVKVQKPDASWENLSTVDNYDGTHVVKINGTSAGKHRVTMEINNQPVPPSPFEIRVIKVKKFGCKGSKGGHFNNPNGVAINKDGNIAVADTDNNRVQIININDGKSLKTLEFPCFQNKFIPYDVAVSADNNYYMTDQGNNQIVISNDTGKYVRSFGHNDLNKPCGITISPVDGNVYVASCKSSKVMIYTPNGSRRVKVIRVNLYGPRYIIINDLGMIFVSDSHQRIQVFNAKFDFLYTCGSKGSGDGQFSRIRGVYYYDKYVYACDYGNNTVQKFDICGSFLCRIDSDSDGLKGPQGIVLTNGTPQKIVVVDRGNHCIRIFVE